jgi:hypothetical protein
VADALEPSLSRIRPSQSRLLSLLRGAQGHPRVFEERRDTASDRDLLEILAWIAGEPVPDEHAPPFDSFARDVQPVLERRGCTEPACHGGPGSGVVLEGGELGVLDNYVRLVARIASGRFPQKPRNVVPHGGGRRLGDAGDCSTESVTAWIERRAPAPCRPRVPPDRERFAQFVQPSLETLTCPRCHKSDDLGFRLIDKPNSADLARNYEEVLAHVDLEYPPVSSVLLRIHESCMQARLLAWLDNVPDPGCTVELANFRGRFPERQPQQEPATR